MYSKYCVRTNALVSVSCAAALVCFGINVPGCNLGFIDVGIL